MKNLCISTLLILLMTSCSDEKFELGNLMEIIHTAERNEYGITFIDEKTVCFTQSQGQPTLMLTHYAENGWSSPKIAPFSGNYTDEYPRYDEKQHRLFFASKRPTNGNKSKDANDIWYVTYTNGEWSEPQHLSGTFSTPGIDSGADAEGETLYFHSDRAGKGLNDVDIYANSLLSTDVPPTKLSISSDQVDGEPFLFHNGNAMLFMSAGHQSVGNGDLFFSEKVNGSWSTPQPVDTSGKVNTTEWEYSPTLTPDGKTLLFTRYVDAQADILAVPVEGLSNGRFRELAAM